MYDDISNLKDKFQEDGFAFQDFSSSMTQDIVNKTESKIITKDDNKKNKPLSNDTLNNNSFSETSLVVKTQQKQNINESIPSYHQGTLVINAKKGSPIKGQKNLIPDNKIFDNQITDKGHANENISLKDILSFIASV